MQRVRVGLTGLAFVFVLVLLAAIFTSPSEEEPITVNMIESGRPGAAAAKQAAEPQEPLAQLGVAPGNAETNKVATPGQPSPSR
jgi:hypothetical protein